MQKQEIWSREKFQEEAELRAQLARNIRAARYADRQWVDVFGKVATDITTLIRASSPYYPGMDRISHIRELLNYGRHDILEVFATGGDK